MAGFWRSKPPPGVQIDRAHPLAQKLAHYFDFSGGGGSVRDRVRLATPTAVVTGQTLATGIDGGPVLETTGAASLAITGGTSPAGGTWTIDAHYVIYVDSGEQNYAGWGDVDGTRQVVHLTDDFSEGTYVRLYGDDSDKIAWPSKILGQWRRVTVTYNAANVATVYLNGRAVGTWPFAGLIAANGTVYVASTKFDRMAGRVSTNAFWTRDLSASEVAELHAAPYQMFASPVWRRYFVPAGDAPPPAARSSRLALLGVS